MLAANPQILLQAGKEEVGLCVKCSENSLISSHNTDCVIFMQLISSLCFLQMLKLCSELEMVVSCCEAKRDKLRETKELCVTFLIVF